MGSWTLVGHWRLPDAAAARYQLTHLYTEGTDGLPSHWRRKFIPKLWYFMVNAGAVFFLPFLSIYWRRELGFTNSQIGLLQALRPWANALAGSLCMPLADILQIHYPMLLATHALTVASRGLMTLPFSFGIMLLLALIMECAVSPMGILVDATVVAGSNKDGTYGRARLWASVGWGGFAPVAGTIVSRLGLHTSFMVFAAIYSAAFIFTALIPAGMLSTKRNALRQSRTIKAATAGEVSTSSGPVALPPLATSASTAATQAVDAGQDTSAAVVTDQQPPFEGAGNDVNLQQGKSQPPTGLQGSLAAGESNVTRRRSRRSEPHSAVAATDGEGGAPRRSLVHVWADSSQRGVPIRGATHSAGAEVVVEIVVTPAGATPGAKAAAQEPAGLEKVDKLQSGGTEAASQESEQDTEGLWVGLRRFLSDIFVLTFLFKAFLMGVGNGFIGYLFLLLSDLGANGTLLGLCLTVNCVAEIPVFYWSGWLIKRLGVELAINISMGAYCLRLGCYALLPYYPSVWMVLPVELLQGITLALAWSAGTVHCRNIAPKRLRSTVQGLYAGLYSGLGAGVGGLIGGMLYDVYDGQMMCAVGAGILLAGWGLANAANLLKTLRNSVRSSMRGLHNIRSSAALRLQRLSRTAPATPPDTV